jgi:hypothetical protein
MKHAVSRLGTGFKTCGEVRTLDCETLTTSISEPWLPFLRSMRKFRMNRIAVFTLLAVLSVSWSIPAKAQGTGATEYAHRSKKANKKAAKEYRKAQKKSMKEQRKAVKKANRPTSHRTPASAHFPK